MQIDNCPCKRDIQGNCPCDPNLNVIANGKANISGALGIAGETLFGGSMVGDPNPLMAGVGKGLSGLSTGGPLGAAIGFLGGYINAGMAKSDYENMLYDQRNRYMQDRTFLPEIAEDGGLFGTSLQTEEGERLVLPSLEISKVKANKEHKDMKRSEITDLVPEGTIVFSKKKTFSPKKYSEKKLTEALSFYDDNDTYDYGPLKVGDILGDDKEMTFAEAIEKVKKYYPTTKEKSLVAEETNRMNLAQREPIIKFLYELQSGGSGSKNSEDPIIAEDGYPNPYDPFSNSGLYADPSITDPMLPIPNQRIIPRFNPYTDLVDPNQNPGLSIDPSVGVNPLVPRGISEVPVLPTAISPIQTSNQIPINVPGMNTFKVDLPDGPTSNPSNKEDDPSLSELMNRLRSRYSQQRNDLNTRHQNDLGDIDRLIRGKNVNNALQLGVQTIASGFQSGYANPALEDTSLIPDQYRGIPQALIDQQSNNIGASGNSTIKALSDAGASPGDIASYAAGVTRNIVNAQSDLRSRNNQISDQNNRAKIADFRRVIQGNNQKLADQENHLTDFNNKRIASVGSFLNQYLGNKNDINDADYKLRLGSESKYNYALNDIQKSEDQTYIAEYQDQLSRSGASPQKLGNEVPSSNNSSSISSNNASALNSLRGIPGVDSYYGSLESARNAGIYRPDNSVVSDNSLPTQTLDALTKLRGYQSRLDKNTVSTIQDVLSQYGYPVKIDGIYGPQTKQYLDQLLKLHGR